MSKRGDTTGADTIGLHSQVEWRTWLKENHGDSGGIWVMIAKKHAPGLHYEEAVEEALCYGWIDSTVKRLDDDSFRQWYSPRKANSAWSRSNKERVAWLSKDGRMASAGLASVKVAKKNGSWELLDAVESLEIPADLQTAFAANQDAEKRYHELTPSHKKQYLYRINSAKRDDTRERRIRETISRLEQGINPGR
jgi:uncharacterized protein YdeI (YjbR/CyaY-like superfamily)